MVRRAGDRDLRAADVIPPKAAVGTSNPDIVKNFKDGYSGSGGPMGNVGGEARAALVAKTEHMAKEIRDLQAQVRPQQTVDAPKHRCHTV